MSFIFINNSLDTGVATVHMQWHMFGSSGHTLQPQSVREGFTERKHGHYMGLGKSFARLSAVETLGIHAHPSTGVRLEGHVSFEFGFQLNRYAIQSKEWFESKMYGLGSHNKEAWTWWYYSHLDYHDVADTLFKDLTHEWRTANLACYLPASGGQSLRTAAFPTLSPPGREPISNLPELSFSDEELRQCLNGGKIEYVLYQDRAPMGERYVANYEVVPGYYLFAVRNLAVHWRTWVTQPDLMEYWWFEAARCSPTQDALNTPHKVWLQTQAVAHAKEDPDFPGEPSRVFFLLQQAQEDMMGHCLWVFIHFLRYWKPLVRRYPQLQMLVRGGVLTDFKSKLMNFYGIPEHRIVYKDLFEFGSGPLRQYDIKASGFGEDNLVFIPPYTSLLNSAAEVLEPFSELAEKLRSAAGLPTKESCKANPTQLILWPKISSVHLPLPLEVFSESVREAVVTRGGLIVDTSALTSIEEQVHIIGTARVIVMTFGSAFDFNSLFMRGATVIACVQYGSYGHFRGSIFCPLTLFTLLNLFTILYCRTNAHGYNFYEIHGLNKAVLTPFLEYNRVFWTNNESEIIDLLDRALAAPPLPCPLKVPWLRRHFPVPKVSPDGEVFMPSLEDYADKDPLIIDY